MDSFQTPGAPHPHQGGMSMDGLHDFGQDGVGIDMRDFDTQRSELDPDMQTPQLQTSGAMSSIPPTQLMTGGQGDDMFQQETGMDDDDDDDDDDAPKKRSKNANGGFTYSDKDGEAGRRKIRIEYITDKSRRHITFSKRKAGIMKKILLLVVSETGLVYTFTTTKLQPLVQKAEGKNLIQACLNAPDGFGPDGQPLTGSVSNTKPKNGGLAIRPHKLTAAASAALAASANAGEAEHAPSGTPDRQMEAGAALGVSSTPNRPKKRLPSGKIKKGGSIASLPEDIPPVPSLSDAHRQSSPSTNPPHLNMALASPLQGGYTYPASHHHAHNVHPEHHAPQAYGQAPYYGHPNEYGSYGYSQPPPPHQYPHMSGVNPAGLQSPYGAPGHGPQSSPVQPR